MEEMLRAILQEKRDLVARLTHLEQQEASLRTALHLSV
jgi:hypothetical protein